MLLDVLPSLHQTARWSLGISSLFELLISNVFVSFALTTKKRKPHVFCLNKLVSSQKPSYGTTEQDLLPVKKPFRCDSFLRSLSNFYQQCEFRTMFTLLSLYLTVKAALKRIQSFLSNGMVFLRNKQLGKIQRAFQNL